MVPKKSQAGSPKRQGGIDADRRPPHEDSENWDARLGFLMHDVSRLRRIVFDEFVRPIGLTRSQWWILAQVSRLHDRAARPLLLLDEAPAHLDETRRAALFAEIEHLGLQAFMTGTEPALFAALQGRAQMVSVRSGALET